MPSSISSITFCECSITCVDNKCLFQLLNALKTDPTFEVKRVDFNM